MKYVTQLLNGVPYMVGFKLAVMWDFQTSILYRVDLKDYHVFQTYSKACDSNCPDPIGLEFRAQRALKF